MAKLKLVLFILPWLLLLIAVAIIVFKPNMFTPAPNKEQIYLDSLKVLQSKINATHLEIEGINHRYDSLLNIDQQVIYRTRDKIRFIYIDADINQLDSIICSSFPGHH
jgi:preprotein translocase subunit SecA